jgi:uncharacterized membrane protein affecting hemolysin expression
MVKHTLFIAMAVVVLLAITIGGCKQKKSSDSEVLEVKTQPQQAETGETETQNSDFLSRLADLFN